MFKWSLLFSKTPALAPLSSCPDRYPLGLPTIHDSANFVQYAAVKIYDYHPVMPVSGDVESSDQSLGDCAICMDAIHVDPSVLRRPTSLDGKSDWEKTSGKGTSKRKTKAGAAGGIFNAVQMGVGSATGRKNYSLAPCHHLFVGFPFPSSVHPLTRSTSTRIV